MVTLANKIYNFKNIFITLTFNVKLFYDYYLLETCLN